MSDPLIVFQLVPLLFLGSISVGTALFTWVKGPRTPLVVTLVLLLVFLGHLALVGALLVLPNDPGIAVRLFPVFQLAVTATALVFLVFLFAPMLDARRVDRLLSTIAFGALLLVGLVLWRPDFYWGATGDGGPLVAMKGVRAAAFALAAWLLAMHALSARRFPQVTRTGALLLSVGFAFVSIHNAATASLRSLFLGEPTPDAGYLAVPLLLGLIVHLVILRLSGRPAVRPLARRYLLAGLVPALLTVLALDLIVLSLVPGGRSLLMLDVVLEQLWMVALSGSVLWVVRQSAVRPVVLSPRHEPTPVAG